MAAAKSAGFLDKAKEAIGKLTNRGGGVERRCRILVVGDQIYIHPLSLLDTGRAWTASEPIGKVARNAVEDSIGAAILAALKGSKSNVQASNGAFERKMLDTTGAKSWQALTSKALCVQVRARDKISVVQPMRIEHGVFSRVEGKELHGDMSAAKLGHLLVEALYSCE